MSTQHENEYYINRGVQGLINPKDTNLYDQNIKNMALITTDNSSDVYKIEKYLNQNFPIIDVIDNKSKMNDFNHENYHLLIIIICTILIDLIAFFPIYQKFKCKLKN